MRNSIAHVGVPTIRPLDDRILVRRIPAENTNQIVVPDVAEPRSTRGVVLAVGPGKRNEEGKRIKCDVLPGQIVHFGPYTDLDRDDWVMIREGDVRLVEQ